jgi:hypothetical protein
MFTVNTRTRKQYDLLLGQQEENYAVRNILNENKWKNKIKGCNKVSIIPCL